MHDLRSDLVPVDVWVDTGGTFTDCLALASDGQVRRAKVLSTSALRGTALETLGPESLGPESLGPESLGPESLRVEIDWPGPDNLVHGFGFVPLGAPTPSALVERFERQSGTLLLDRAVPHPPFPFAFELRSADEAPVLAARMLTGVGAHDPLPPIRMRLATTRGTNALLERKGAPTALFVTRGFADLLVIGTQQRPELFTLRVERAPPLYARVVEVPERISAAGAVVTPLDPEAVRRLAREVRAAGINVAALCLLNSYRNDHHEREVEEILREVGFERVSRSSAISRSIGYLDRTQTTLVNAYLEPVVSGYVDRVGSALGTTDSAPSSLHLMTSSGGLVRAAEFRPKDSLLSGPAGGVIGAVGAAAAAGFDRVLAFDMGGTSTDVARFDGTFDYAWSHEVGDVRLFAPALAIESVAAGGGSICSYGTAGLVVGPGSAGASPGPACYGAGGPLTLTDCNLLLGRIDPGAFGVPLSTAAAEDALAALLDTVRRETGEMPAPEDLLSGLIAIANERMAGAIRSVSLRVGYDPADYALVVFGGAGGQHGCGVADSLGIRTQVVPPDASLLSAWGIGRARLERVVEAQVLRTLEPAPTPRLPAWLREVIRRLSDEAINALAREGASPDDVDIGRIIANARLSGQDSTIPVELTPLLAKAPLPAGSTGYPDHDFATLFVTGYERVFGHRPESRPIEIESLRVIASEISPPRVRPAVVVPRSDPSRPHSQVRRRMWVNGQWREVPCYARGGLAHGAELRGPCLVIEPHTSILIEHGWGGMIDPSGALVLTRAGSPEMRHEKTGAAMTSDPVTEQLFTSRFERIVDEMGEQLRRTAISTNVKERMDFSCALLDASGELVANAPHIPVHLGALGICVRAIAGTIPLDPGDVVITNHPAFGGSHLPDISVVTPVHSSDGVLLGYVANRAHHAEIGGTRPGSMPPAASTLVEEGVTIPPFVLLKEGVARWNELRRLLESAPYPSRAVDENLADLRAQAAANKRGLDLLRELAATHGVDLVRSQMDLLTARSERLVRAALRGRGDGRFTALESLDSGARLAVAVTIEGDRATFDFAGTSDVQPGNLNATPAIVSSAVLYVLRLLIDESLPLNEGLLRPVSILLPRSFLNPEFGDDATRLPALVGGNTELSQRIVDTLLKALGLAACSQGTMNNLLWGNERFGYYETIGGGEGASPGHDGCSAVHTHMTNTRITDAEVLEHRYPVRVERFGVRRGSGGDGRWRGGDGIVREILFLDSVSISVLTQHRKEGPYGVAGGLPGAPGWQRLRSAKGEWLEMDSVDGCEAGPGDRILVETPGGGGWGRADERREGDAESVLPDVGRRS